MKDISKRIIVISIVFCLLFSNFARLISFAVDELPFEVTQDVEISNELENTNEKIYKGVLYENALSDSVNELEYNNKLKVKISDIEDLEKLNIIDSNDKIIYKDGSINNLDKNEYYKKIKISREEFLEVFGKDGFINVLDKNSNMIYTITENSDVDENGKLTLTFGIYCDAIILETSKPVKIGTLNIDFLKAIRHTNEFKVEEIDNFEKIECDSQIQFVYKKVVVKEVKKVIEDIKPEEEIVKDDMVLESQNDAETSKDNLIVPGNDLENNEKKSEEVINNTENEQEVVEENTDDVENIDIKEENDVFVLEQNDIDFNYNSLKNLKELIGNKHEEVKNSLEENKKEDNSDESNLKDEVIESEIITEEKNGEEAFNDTEKIESKENETNEDSKEVDKELEEVEIEEVKEQEEVEEFETVEEIVEELKIEDLQSFVELLDVKGRIDIEMSNIIWSTLTENRINLNAILRTDEYSNRLFQNPMIEIELPTEVEKVEIENVNIMYKGDLSLDTWHISEAANGAKKVIVILKGTQTKYDINAINGGLNLMINLKVDLFEDTPTKDSSVKLLCMNNNEIYQNEMMVKLQSKYGLLSLNKFSVGEENVKALDSQIKTIKMPVMQPAVSSEGEMKLINNYNEPLENAVIIGKLPSAKEDGDITEDTFNIRLTGPIEVTGKSVTVYYTTEKSAEIESEFWTETVDSFENVRNFKIVFNENIMPEEVVKIKYNMTIPENLEYNNEAYVNTIVTYTRNGVEESKSSRLGATTGIGPKVDVKITPEISSDFIYSGQVITYDIEVENVGSEDIENVTVKANIPDELAYTEYKTFENPARNTHAEFIDNEEIKEKTWSIDFLKTSEKKVYKLELRVKKFDTETKNFDFMVETINKDGVTFAKNTISQIAHKGELDVELNTNKYYSKYNVGDSICYTIRVENKSDRVLKDVIVESPLPQYTELEYAYVLNETNLLNIYDFKAFVEKEGKVNNNIIKYEIGNINPGEQKLLILSVKISKFYQEEVTIENRVEVYESLNKGNIYDSNIIRRKSNTMILDINQTSTTPKNIVEGDSIDYKINIKNISNFGGIILLEDNIPNEIKVNSIIIKLSSENKIELIPNNTIQYSISINPNSEIEIEIKGIAKELEDDIMEKTINNSLKAYIRSDDFEETEKIVNIIEKRAHEDDDITENDIIEDELEDIIIDEDNKEDQKQEEEYINKEEIVKPDSTSKNEEKNSNSSKIDNKIENVTVYDDELIENEISKDTEDSFIKRDNSIMNEISNSQINNSIVKRTTETVSSMQKYKISGNVWLDFDENGESTPDENGMISISVKLYNSNGESSIKETTTDKDGNYEFSGLEKGTYLVVFEYDTLNYDATEYQKSGVNSENNSKARNKTLKINNQEKLVAITDRITISDRSISDINLGLIMKDKFDLALEKLISKVTVENSKGTSEYLFDDNKFGKIDLESKLLDSTVLKIEYKFIVTNQGTVDAYVNKIEDYKDDSVDFSDSNNIGWILEDGKLYNNSLTNTILKPGEKKEFKLVLTKKMTSDNLGVLANSAEITEAENIKGLKEYDSILGNKNESEDDYSKVEILLGIRTGRVTVYTSLGLTIFLIGISIYLIKKKIWNKNIIK